MDLFEVIDAILDGNKWPTYTNSKQLSDLDGYAGVAFKRDTFDGYLSYVLISHQTNEDYAILLLRHVQFTVRLHVMQSGFNLPMAKYETPGMKTSDMFGRILESLRHSIDFDYKSEFIDACTKQNQLRNRLAHRLIEGMTLAEIRSVAEEYRAGSDEVVGCFNSADEHFSSCYCDQLHNPVWPELIRGRIKSGGSPDEIAKWETLLDRFAKDRDSALAKWRKTATT